MLNASITILIISVFILSFFSTSVIAQDANSLNNTLDQANSSNYADRDNYQQGGIDESFLKNSKVGMSITTNKQMYLPGETVIVLGSVFNGTSPFDTTIDIKIVKEGDDSLHYFYTSRVLSKNGTFTIPGYSAPYDLGRYHISASIADLAPFTTSVYEVVNPLFTIQYLMLILAFGCFGGLIIVILKSGKINFATSEILRFVLISGVVVSPIIGLLFSDSELGINSPISLIVKQQIKSDQTETDAIWKNQWFIAVGGMKIDNYMSGILIPIYVIIFGLAGGYLRYLYNTSIKIWHLDTSSDVLSSNIRLSLFDWNKVPADQIELDKFKSFLIKSLNADWIAEGKIDKLDNNKIIATSKDQSMSITIQAYESDNIATVKLGDIFYGNLQLEKQQNGHLYVYQTIERKTWSFYQSLTDLSLLLLSPLLAIAGWFILTRGGDIDKYIVALVSFTVGLATYTIISTLTDFTANKIKTQASNPQNS
jgi:hypothetical protein